jgi:hypothetical protein
MVAAFPRRCSQALREAVVATGRDDLDIVDNPFHKMMQGNRGVL